MLLHMRSSIGYLPITYLLSKYIMGLHNLMSGFRPTVALLHLVLSIRPTRSSFENSSFVQTIDLRQDPLDTVPVC